MNINDLKAKGQVQSVSDETTVQNITVTTPIEEGDIVVVPKQETNPSSERKVVSIGDMVASGAVKKSDNVEPGDIDKVVEQVFAEGSLNEAIARRRLEVDKLEEEKILEEGLGEELSESELEETEISTDELLEDIDDDIEAYEKEVLEDNMMEDELEMEPVEVESVETEKEIITEPAPVLSENDESTHNVLLEENEDKDINPIKDFDYDKEIAKLESNVVNNEDLDEDAYNKLKEMLAEKMKVNNHDLTGFTVIKRPVSLSNALSLPKQNTRSADWVLYNTGTPITMSEFLGEELEIMSNAASSRNKTNTVKEIYGRMYQHVTSPKPSTYEAWLKSISYFDIDHLFFAVYRACFEGVNFLPYTCSDNKCKHIFLTDNVDTMEMVKFHKPEVKEKFDKIFGSTDYNAEGLFATKVVPISDTYAIGLKEPSIYDMLVDNVIPDVEFNNKYRAIINMLPYIDDFYVIDYNNKGFRPVAYKTFANNIEKTKKARIISYAAVIHKLTSDQYSNMTGLISKMMSRDDTISYVLPEVTCTKCNHTVEAIDANASELVFTRHRLGAVQSI